MYLKKMIMTAIGVCLLGCSVLPTAAADMTTRRHVVTFLEANSKTGLAQEMLPNVLNNLVELYRTKAVESADISRYGAYLSQFQSLKSLFYEVAEWTEMSESAVLMGEHFVLGIGMDPLQQYGRHLHALEFNQQMTQEQVAEIVGYSRGAIAIIEQGRGMPGQELREALIGLFGEPLDSTLETKFGILAVRMEDGTWISENTGIDTFIEVIKKLGIEEVKKLDLHVNGIPLIADCDYDGKAQRKVETETGTYWIVSGTNTEKKKKILDDIANQLNVDMTVFANPRA